jgi:hypothetical protein
MWEILWPKKNRVVHHLFHWLQAELPKPAVPIMQASASRAKVMFQDLPLLMLIGNTPRGNVMFPFFNF